MRKLVYIAPGIGNWTEVPDLPNAGCSCDTDGFCSRYGREMRGRMREICRGENVDAGEAAHLRAQWEHTRVTLPVIDCPHRGAAVIGEKRVCLPCGGAMRQVFACTHPALVPNTTTIYECGECEYKPKATGEPLLLVNNLAPGDALVMSAAIYSLHKALPGKYSTSVQTSADELFKHSPYVGASGGRRIEMHYPGINYADTRSIHFMQAYCEFLESVLGVTIPLATNRPRVYLSKEETSWKDQVHETTGQKRRFWLICAGVKNDFTTKQWPYYQQVVDALPTVNFVQVGLDHAPLRGVLNLVGKTDIRQLMRLVYHCDGVLCPTTLLMHLAAAFEKPAVVLLGGREPVQWNSYPKQHLLHSIGSLSCCKNGACWKSRVVPLNDGMPQDSSLCEKPTFSSFPECMASIAASTVVELIERLDSR